MILVDSDVLIAHLRGVPAGHGWLCEARSSGLLAVSALTVTELVGGMRSDERRSVWTLLRAFRTEPVTELIGRRAGEFMRQYRRNHGAIGTVDYVIAATAELLGADLATWNTGHFPMWYGLRPPFVVG